MASGFFLGIWLGIIIIILGIEFYYYIIARYIEKDLTIFEAIIFIICLIISINLLISSLGSNTQLFFFVISLALMPVTDLIIRAFTRSKEKIIQHRDEENEIKNWLYTIEKQPENVNAYVALGDIYFQQGLFEKALEYYQRAKNVMELPYITAKIKSAEKEIRIKKGIIWVCPECSFDNPGEIQQCKICGYSKMDGNLIRDIKNQKKELLKGVLFIVLGPLCIIFLIALYIIMPVYLAFIVTMLLIYLAIRFFITY